MNLSLSRFKASASVRFSRIFLELQSQWPLSRRFIHRLDLALDQQYQRTGPTYAQVLCVYKRAYLRDQIIDLLSQTVLPTTLFVYQNDSHARIKPFWSLPRLKAVRFTHNISWNSYYHGRFYVALMSQEPMIIVWDDDISPGSGWNEYTLRKSREYNGSIVTANGRLLVVDASGSGQCFHELRTDDPLFDGCDVEDTFVDYGGHSWTFPRAALNAMAGYHPPTLSNSEDFHLSAAAYLKCGIRTIMPAQSSAKRDTCAEDYLHSTRAWDRHASFLANQSSGWRTERLSVVNHWIANESYTPLALRT